MKKFVHGRIVHIVGFQINGWIANANEHLFGYLEKRWRMNSCQHWLLVDGTEGIAKEGLWPFCLHKHFLNLNAGYLIL